MVINSQLTKFLSDCKKDLYSGDAYDVNKLLLKLYIGKFEILITYL